MSEDSKAVREDGEMMTMFATAWVKVEVEDMEEETEPGDLSEQDEASDAGDVFGPGGVPEPVVVLETASPQELKEESKDVPKKKKKRVRKLLFCDKCDYSTVYKNCLTIHTAGHDNSKPHQCHLCDYSSRTPSCLQRHMSIKHRESDEQIEKKYACNACEYTTYCNWNLQAHKRKHKTEKQYKCRHCEYETAYRNAYVKHSKTHEEKPLYKCDKCPYETIFEGRIKRHLAMIHNENFTAKHVCDLCGFSNKESWKLKKHLMRSKLETEIKCTHCDYKTLYKCEFKQHKLKHINKGLLEQINNRRRVKLETPNEPKQCEQCAFIAKSQAELERHILETHSSMQELYIKCDYCGYTTLENWRYNMHMRNSKSDSPIKCSHCIFTTFYKCEIRKHKYFSHYSEIYGNGRTIDCSNLKDQIMAMICFPKDDIPDDSELNVVKLAEIATEFAISDKPENAFLNTIALPENPVSSVEMTPQIQTEHGKSNNYRLDGACLDWHSIEVLESSDKERPFQCSFCEYTSKFKSSVQRHFQRRHTGRQNRPYRCVNCDFSTKTKDQIALHNRRSQINKILKCDTCEFSTSYKCAMVHHQKLHFTFKCNVCSYSCRHKHELTKHFATYHLGNGMKCSYCDFTAIRKDSILCHETIHTGVKPYKCSICDYASVRKSLLDYHMKKHHSGETGSIEWTPGDEITENELMPENETLENDMPETAVNEMMAGNTMMAKNETMGENEFCM